MRSLVFLLVLALAGCGAAHARAVRAPPAHAADVAEAELGLDLRALPTGASAPMIDSYVLAQGDDIRARTPAGVTVEIRHVPGWGVLYARFRSRDALARCRDVIARYMAHAPTLPVTRDPAARITTACH